MAESNQLLGIRNSSSGKFQPYLGSCGKILKLSNIKFLSTFMPSKMSENWKSYMLFCRILFQFMPAILMTSLYTTIFLKVREQEQLMSRYTYKQKVKYVQAYRNVQLRYFVLIRNTNWCTYVQTRTNFSRYVQKTVQIRINMNNHL